MRTSGMFVLACLLGSALSAPSDFQGESKKIESSSSWEMISRTLGSCMESDDVTACLGVKAATALDRISRMQKFEILPGIQFKRDSVDSVRDGKSLESENEIVSSLPANNEERMARVFDMVKDSIAGFADTHSLQVKLAPEEISSAARAFSEARGKLKKLLGPILLGVAVKVLAFLTIFGGGLALLVTKALIVSKLALVVASVLGLQKLLGSSGSSSSLIPSKSTGWSNAGVSNGGQWTTGGASQGWSQGGSSSATGYPYARSIQTEAQEQAYGAQKQ